MPGADVEPGATVLDASVAVRWLTPEPGTDEALALLEQSVSWIAPRLILTEVAAALRRKVADGEVLLEEALQGFDAFAVLLAKGTLRVANDEDIVRAALLLALSLGHKVPDCMYLALAEHTGAGLATADRRLGALAERRGVPTIFVPSA